MLEDARKLWLCKLFASRGSKLLLENWGEHACIGQQLMMDASEGLHTIVCGVGILVGAFVWLEKLSLSDCCISS